MKKFPIGLIDIMYKDMGELYPARIENKNVIIEPFKMTYKEVKTAVLTANRSPLAIFDRYLQANKIYHRMFINNELFMSDTPMEKCTNNNFIQKANGGVLVFGLGMGLIIYPLLSDPDVKSVAVVELNESVIDLVYPVLKSHDPENKLTVLKGDAFNYLPRPGTKYDTIYFDIWPDSDPEYLTVQRALHKKFRRFLNKDNPLKFMGSWCYEYYMAAERLNTKNQNRLLNSLGGVCV